MDFGLRFPRLCLFLCEESGKSVRRRRVLSSQLIPRQPLAYKSSQRLQEASLVAIFILPLIKAEALLIQIAEQVEGLYAHVCPFDRPLQKRPEVLHSVRVNRSFRIAFRMVDDLMRVVCGKAVIALAFIGVDFRSREHVVTHVALQDFLLRGFHMPQDHAARLVPSAALKQSLDWRHHVRATAQSLLLRSLLGVHDSGAATDERFVHFYNSLPAHLHDAALLQSQPHALKHEPCCPLGDLDVLPKFIAADPILAVRNLPERKQPLVESDGAVFHHRPDLDRELLPAHAFLARPELSSGDEANLVRTAPRAANHARRPANGLHVFKRSLFVRKVADGFLERFWGNGFGIHGGNYLW